MLASSPHTMSNIVSMLAAQWRRLRLQRGAVADGGRHSDDGRLHQARHHGRQRAVRAGYDNHDIRRAHRCSARSVHSDCFVVGHDKGQSSDRRG